MAFILGHRFYDFPKGKLVQNSGFDKHQISCNITSTDIRKSWREELEEGIFKDVERRAAVVPYVRTKNLDSCLSKI